MSKHTRRKVTSQHKDSATKNTLNPPDRSRAAHVAPEPGPSGVEERVPKRQVGQFTGPGQPPVMKK